MSRLLLSLLLLLLALRWSLADLADPLLASLWAGAAVALALPGLWRRAPGLRPHALLWAALSWALLGLVSSLWSWDPGASLQTGMQQLAAVLFALALAGMAARHRVALTWALSVGACMAAAVAMRQMLFSFPALRAALAAGQFDVENRVRRTAEAGRTFGSFFAPDMLAGALVVALLLTLGLAAVSSRHRRVLALLAATLQGLALLSTRSVGAAVALLAAGAVVAVVVARHTRGRRRVVALAAAVGIVVLGLVAALPRWQGVEERALERLQNQRTAFRALPRAPLLGHGLDSFGSVAPALRQEREPLTRYAHGVVGQAATDLGGLGLLVVGLCLLALGHRLWVGLRDPPADALQLAGLAALAAGGVHALVDYDLMFGENLLPLLAAALIAAPEANTASAADAPPRGSIRGGLLLGTGLVLLALLGWNLTALAQDQLDSRQSCRVRLEALERRWAWRPVDAERERRSAIEALRCRELGEARAATVLRWTRRAQASRPHDAFLRGELGVSLARAGRLEEAGREVSLAQDAWPRVGRVYVFAAQVAWLAGDEAAARSGFARSLALDLADPSVQRYYTAFQRQLERAGLPPAPPLLRSAPAGLHPR